MSKKVVKKSKKKKVKKAYKPDYSGRVRHFHIAEGLPTPEEIRDELEGYREVLLGRVDPPYQKGVLTLMETAEAYFARACEIEQLILRAKAEGRLPKGSGYDTLRTQEIRSFKELSKSATELGSRRLTFENLRMQQEMRGLESA
jgi:hypothetical protein